MFRRHCAHDGCRATALKRSELCWHHDTARRQTRLTEIRAGKGKPPTLAESVRLFRANLKTLWTRSPWWPGATIWLAPRLEAVFAEDTRRAGLSLSRTAPCVSNTLRWCWRRSCLNHDDSEGWQRSLAAAKKRAAKIGEPPGGYVFDAPGVHPPADLRIKRVERRASAFEAASANPVIDRATRTRQRQQVTTAPRTPSNFDWQMFLNHRWLDVFSSIWRAYRLSDEDFDGEVGRVLAIAYKNKLDEQEKRGGMVGPASRRWHQLLGQLRQGARPGQTPIASRLAHQVPPIAPTPAARRVWAPDNDAVMREIFDRVLGRPGDG
jgi:hypothetical protein